MNITSSFTEGPEQNDGRVQITEEHFHEDGRVFKYEYLCDKFITDPSMVAEARRNYIIDQLTKRENALAIIVGTSVPLTKHQFLSRFTTNERITIRERAKTNPVVLDFMEMLNASSGVFYSLALQGIGYLQYLEIITPARAAIIGEPW